MNFDFMEIDSETLERQIGALRRDFMMDAKSLGKKLTYDIARTAKICVARPDDSYHDLFFYISEELFSKTNGQANREMIEKKIFNMFHQAFPYFHGSSLKSVKIRAISPYFNNDDYIVIIDGERTEGTVSHEIEDVISHGIANIAIPESDLESIWDNPDHMRLFISHTVTHAKDVKKLKDELKKYKISSFVAHEDINPTKEWATEITNALYSMDVFLTYITDDFNNSCWTNQEIGFAYAKKSLIISMKLSEKDPVGFISSKQAMRANLNDAKETAEKIFNIICKEFTDKEFLENWANTNGINLNES